MYTFWISLRNFCYHFNVRHKIWRKESIWQYVHHSTENDFRLFELFVELGSSCWKHLSLNGRGVFIKGYPVLGSVRFSKPTLNVFCYRCLQNGEPRLFFHFFCCECRKACSSLTVFCLFTSPICFQNKTTSQAVQTNQQTMCVTLAQFSFTSNKKCV